LASPFFTLITTGAFFCPFTVTVEMFPHSELLSCMQTKRQSITRKRQKTVFTVKPNQEGTCRFQILDIIDTWPKKYQYYGGDGGGGLGKKGAGGLRGGGGGRKRGKLRNFARAKSLEPTKVERESGLKGMVKGKFYPPLPSPPSYSRDLSRR